MRRISLVIAMSMYCTTVACSPAHPLAAAYCASVAAYHTSDRRQEIELTRMIEEFAHENKLELSGGERVDDNEYIDKSKGIGLEVTYGLGKFGTGIALFYRGSVGDTTRNALNDFLFKRVNPIFRVRKCSDIPGAGVPEVSDWP